MKKLFCVTVALVMSLVAAPAQAATIDEIRAMIAQLSAQISSMNGTAAVSNAVAAPFTITLDSLRSVVVGSYATEAYNPTGDYQIRFNVTAGNEDLYLYNNASSTQIRIVDASTGAVTPYTGAKITGSSFIAGATAGTNNRVKIPAGTQVRFSIEVYVDNIKGVSGTYAVELAGLYLSNSATGTVTLYPIANPEDFRTNGLYLKRSCLFLSYK